MKRCLLFLLLPFYAFAQNEPQSWIRINQLGYTPGGLKVAVWVTKEDSSFGRWELVERMTGKLVMIGYADKDYGAYGPFKHSHRLNFTAVHQPGEYILKAGGVSSPAFRIGQDVYNGAADFCLRYMRQQRTGFNPFLKDSCHTHDGYVLYGEKAGIKDSTHIDVVGGWHDASDYLQYSSTSANATYHLLAAYRDFPKVFGDEKQANGLDGRNGRADVLDEAKWGLDWLLKMHPKDDWMFNQIGDDRDHMGMRIPKEDTNYYGPGLDRPVYFINGEPQQRGKFMNATTGTSSTAGKFSSAFSLGSYIFRREYELSGNKREYMRYSELLMSKAGSAFKFGRRKPGNTQTVSVRSPYIYAEDNWVDDMELAAASFYTSIEPHQRNYNNIELADSFARLEPQTLWLGTDTAKHYQWYPFINIGHYELAKVLSGKKRERITGFYKTGIEKVWNKAKTNAFYRGIPYIWCSNNLTTSFAIQCYWYKQLTGDRQFSELEQANFDWLFGCNPWGTSMVYGLPAWGDTPVDPHSAFTHLKNYPIDGGLVDGPVNGSIFNGLIGIQLKDADEYAAFQSNLAVYHDDYGDYSTNEPTMDGTASLIYLLAAKEAGAEPIPDPPHPMPWESLQPGPKRNEQKFSHDHGAITRGDSTRKEIALVFTGHEYGEGGHFIDSLLLKERIQASFFFTGDFYRNEQFRPLIKGLRRRGHYLGAHSDKHLLYCDWSKRDSLLISEQQFSLDLADNYAAMAAHGIEANKAKFFLPPYEWYNDSIAVWTRRLGMQLINYTPGTRSTADYTTQKDKNYRDSETIFNSITGYEAAMPSGLNGFILLLHAGAGPGRTDKFYYKLPELIKNLKTKGYQFVRIDELLKE